MKTKVVKTVVNSKSNKKKNNCTTVEEMKEKFVADGWSKDITFTEFTLEEATERGLQRLVKDAMKKGEKLFKMGITGNIFKSNGDIAYYNIPVLPEAVEMDFRVKRKSNN